MGSSRHADGGDGRLALALPGEPQQIAPDEGDDAAPVTPPQDAFQPVSKRRKKKRKETTSGAADLALAVQPDIEASGDAGSGDGAGRESLEVVPMGESDVADGAEGAVVRFEADPAGPKLGWRDRAQQLKAQASDMKLKAKAMKEGDLGSAGGCFASEAAFDAWIDVAMIGLLVLVCLCSLSAQVSPWAHGSSSYVAPYDSAKAKLEVSLWLWHGEFHLEQQATDPPPPPPIHCWTDEHVVDGHCVACAAGKIRPAGDDRTQGDTDCVNERGLVISVFNVGASVETDAESGGTNTTNETAVNAPVVRPAPPPPTASGPMLEVVGGPTADISYGATVDLSPGMHQGIARVFELDGTYQLPPASGALWIARLLLLLSVVVACAGIGTLRKLLRFHRAVAKRAAARRRKAMPDPPVELINRSRAQVVLCAAFCAIGFVMGHNATVPTVGATIVRCCSMFAAGCGSRTAVMYGAGLALLGAIVAALT
jgi:hypothetical protein